MSELNHTDYQPPQHVCPIMKGTCQRHACGFWVAQTARCAIPAIAESLWDINDTLHTIEEAL